MFHNRAAFLGILCLLMVAVGVLSSFRPFQSTGRLHVRPASAIPGGPEPLLIQGQSVSRELESSEEHVYSVSLSAGDFLVAKVDQIGIDVAVTLLDPVEKPVIRIDSPNGRRGEEPLRAVAEVSGRYSLRVRGGDIGWRGSYRIIIQDVRPASAADRACATALQILAEGDDAFKQRPEFALERFQTAFRTWSSISDPWGQILALERLGDYLDQQGLPRDALTSYNLALSLTRSIADRDKEARISIRSALMLLRLGDLRQAEAIFRRVLDDAVEDGSLESQAEAHYNLGLISATRGEVQKALASFRIAEELWRQLDEPVEEARILSSRGEIFLAVGQFEVALKTFNKALDLLRLEKETALRVSILNGAGRAYQELSHLDRAVWAYRLALELARIPRERASTLNRLGQVLREQGRLSQAAAVLEEALRLARSQEDPRREAYVLADLASVEASQGRQIEAIRGFEQALLIFQELEDPASMASVLYGRAEVERDLGHLENATALIERSLGFIETLRSELSAPDMRASFFASRRVYYELYVDLLMERHRHRPQSGYEILAFEVGERSRARSLLDDMGGSSTASATMTLGEVQREVMDQDSLLLAYLLGDRRSTLWAITSDSISVFDLPPRVVIEEMALRVWRSLSNGSSGGTDLGRLSNILFPPGIGPLKQQRLLIIPDGALHLIPFSALCDPGLYAHCQPQFPLVLNHEVVNLPSATVVGRMRKRWAARNPAPGFVAVLADPVFRQDDPRLVRRFGRLQSEIGPDETFRGAFLQRLIYSRKEAESILKLVPPDKRFGAFGFAATREIVANPEFAQHKILHFATHNVDAGHPELSGLVLSGFDETGRPRNGFLRAEEIYNLRLPAELVILSACKTGLDAEFRSDSPRSLTRAFMHAGAKRVLVSLWNVRDEETAELMTRFYEGMLRRDLSPAQALQFAQSSMASNPRWSSPRSWAGFVLQGEPR